jgi:hypothetical protein
VRRAQPERIIQSSRLVATDCPHPSMQRFLLLAATVCLVACRDPRAEANIAQAMIDVGTQMSAMQQDYAVLQQEVDSLRLVVAQQDTIIGRLASMAGLPIAPR